MDCHSSGHERLHRHQDFVPWLYTQRKQGELEGGAATRHRDGEGGPAVGCELPFEFPHPRPHGESGVQYFPQLPLQPGLLLWREVRTGGGQRVLRTRLVALRHTVLGQRLAAWE